MVEITLALRKRLLNLLKIVKRYAIRPSKQYIPIRLTVSFKDFSEEGVKFFYFMVPIFIAEAS